MESWIFFWKNPKNCSKITKKSLFFPLFGKKSFLNRTLGLSKSFLNQTTYVLKNRLLHQSFLNGDSFLNHSFLNRNSSVLSFFSGKTLLPQYLGMYRLTVDNVEHYLVVMRNVFSNHLNIHMKYDLKGKILLEFHSYLQGE